MITWVRTEIGYLMQEQFEKNIGRTQKKILQNLLQAKAPLRVEALSQILNISRNATYQHMMSLERDGLIERASIAQTKGRPSQTYQLSQAGRHHFPKHYALFANLLVELVKTKMGSEELNAYLKELGQNLATEFTDRVEGLKGKALFKEIASIMGELGYESELMVMPDQETCELKAYNCVFHELAQKHEEVCTLDIELISKLVGKPVEQCDCVLRGGSFCRFRVLKK